MDRRTKDTLRVGATALGVAAGLLALASTAQTPDGYIHANFGGPLDVFSSGNSADVLSIGDGSNDATELAALLKGPVGPAAKDGTVDSPYRIAYEAGTAPNGTTGAATVIPPFDLVAPPADGKAPAILPNKPVVDAQGRIDCTGAVSCKTDPSTNITTVTYPDGLVAVVQKINDLTVVAYKTLTEALPSEIATLLPPVPTSPPVLPPVPTSPPVLAAVDPSTSNAPSAVPSAPSTAAQTPDPSSSPPVLDLPALRTPPSGVTPPKDTSPSGPGSTAPAPNLPSKVKEAIGGVVDTVKGAVDSVGKALSPGASTKPLEPGPATEPSDNPDTGRKSDPGTSDAGQP